MKYVDEYDLENFKNEAENLVFAELDKQLGPCEDAICTCAECVKDMAAMALNSVKPLYRHSLLGTLYVAQTMNEDEEYAEGIRTAVSSAIKKVSGNPAHEVVIGNNANEDPAALESDMGEKETEGSAALESDTNEKETEEPATPGSNTSEGETEKPTTPGSNTSKKETEEPATPGSNTGEGETEEPAAKGSDAGEEKREGAL